MVCEKVVLSLSMFSSKARYQCCRSPESRLSPFVLQQQSLLTWKGSAHVLPCGIASAFWVSRERRRALWPTHNTSAFQPIIFCTFSPKVLQMYFPYLLSSQVRVNGEELRRTGKHRETSEDSPPVSQEGPFSGKEWFSWTVRSSMRISVLGMLPAPLAVAQPEQIPGSQNFWEFWACGPTLRPCGQTHR